jgi:hypothetical protein
MNSVFLKLSEGLFLFGQGGVNRIEPIDNRYSESVYKTVIYNNLTKISAVTETVAEIEKMLVDKLVK